MERKCTYNIIYKHYLSSGELATFLEREGRREGGRERERDRQTDRDKGREKQ